MMLRTDIINHLINRYKYQNYLEIGVQNPQQNFNHIVAMRKVGVDPSVHAGATFTLTSDDYFYMLDKGMSGTVIYDIVFVDGLHVAEQAYKDIFNAYRYLSPNGTIVVHDCSPPDEDAQKVPMVKTEWTGNVWKAWLKFRADDQFDHQLNMMVVDTDYGVGVIRKSPFNPLPDTIPHTMIEKIRRFELSYQEFDENRKDLLNLVSPDEFMETLS